MVRIRAAVAALTLFAIACTVLVVFQNDGLSSRNDELVMVKETSRRVALMKKLRQLLPLLQADRKSVRRAHESRTKTQQAVATPEETSPVVASSKMSKEELEKAACQDGEPCNFNAMPQMKYIPETGAWDVVSMGNPDAVWRNLMDKARTRDRKLHAQRMQKFQHPEQTQADVDRQHTEQLAQVVAVAGDGMDSMKHKELERKLKMILQAKLDNNLSGQHHTFSPSSFATPASDDDTADDATTRWTYRLSAHLREAERLLDEIHNSKDVNQMLAVAEVLGDQSKLRHVCRHTQLAQNVLHVLEASSLSGCARQLRVRMDDLRNALKSRASKLRFVDPTDENTDTQSGGGSGDSLSDGHETYSALRHKKLSLSTQLDDLKHDHDNLEEKLRQEQSRISQLTREKTQQSFHAEAVSSEQHGHTSSSAPPVPSGLPPGYTGR